VRVFPTSAVRGGAAGRVSFLTAVATKIDRGGRAIVSRQVESRHEGVHPAKKMGLADRKQALTLGNRDFSLFLFFLPSRKHLRANFLLDISQKLISVH